MEVERRIDLRLELFVGGVKAGKLPARWNDEEKLSLVGNLRYMNTWLWGHIAATLKFRVPHSAFIAEHAGQSPGKAWSEAEEAGSPGQVDRVIEAIMREFDFADPDERARMKGPLAQIAARAAVALNQGQRVLLGHLSALAKANFKRNHGAWLDRLDRANTHSRRGRLPARRKRTSRMIVSKEPYKVGSLGFKTWRGDVRPRLDLLACPLDRLLAPLYSAALESIDKRQRAHAKWADMAELIRLYRNPRAELMSVGSKVEFPDLTGQHVRRAVQRTLRIGGKSGA